MLDTRYDHRNLEEKIYKLWEKSGYFNPDNLPAQAGLPGKKSKPFTIIMPPPNANGALHMGHAVGMTLEDIMIRFNRMRGRKTLWLPGADHAGFETQVVFDKKLEKEGRNRYEIPREKLWADIWDFTQKNKEIMYAQTKKLGASCDWSREIFTLDPKIIDIVYETFEKLYKDGLVYRDLKVVNWCPKHKTALSDLEVKYVERTDPLYYIKYGPLTLATVRPETKFGDTALAVNPKDKRYKKYVGETIEAQGILGPLKFKIIADSAVDSKFGTGVIKVTPAHDATDFEIWQRHKNEIPGPKIIIDENGRLTGETQEFKGLKVAEAREKVAAKMKEIGILEKVEPNYVHQVATCYKCGSTLEPLPKPQWFIKMKPLAEPAIKALKAKKFQILPKRSEKVYLHWLRNIRDWNISRQIIWGIRIPAWYCGGLNYKVMGFAGDIVAQVFESKTRTYRLRDYGWRVGDVVPFQNSKTGEVFGYGVMKEVEQTTVGKIDLKDPKHWATYDKREELIAAFKRHHPEMDVKENTPVWVYTYEFKRGAPPHGCGEIILSSKKPTRCPKCDSHNLEQDPDVFDTWFSSGQWPYATLQIRGNDLRKFYPTDVMETGYDILFFWVARMVMLGLYRTGKIPFKTVYLHGLVRDADRQKMSKSKGNVTDPLGVAEIYGADAVRMALVVGNTAGNDMIISEEKIRGYRNFATKIWNVARFVLMNEVKSAVKPRFTAADRKNLNNLKKTKAQITKHLEKFEFHLAAEKIYHYIWHEFADKIIEASKLRLKSEKEAEKIAAYKTIETILTESIKILHPFMPYVTEEIYQNLPNHPKKTLMIENW